MTCTRMVSWVPLAVVAAAAVAAAGCSGGSSLDPTACLGVANGTGCGGGKICNRGSCVAPKCGDGIVTGSEECDDGNAINGDGCNNDCTYSCTQDSDCDDHDACSGTETCDTSLHLCRAGTPEADGTACTISLGSVGDGGVGMVDGGMPPTVAGTCVSGHCGRPCTADSDCSDDNVCDGIETCNTTYNVCQRGTPLNCDDRLACTVDSCDPVTGCQHTLIDADGDGYAPYPADGVACDDRGGDCNDNDPNINPAAPELCHDHIDNNCNGLVDEAPTWYRDCDGDGYAAADQITQGVTQCDKPLTTPQCIDWTTRTPSGAANIDCDDTVAQANPGVAPDAWFAKPYCHGGGEIAPGSYPNWNCTGTGVHPSFDYDCSGTSDREPIAGDGNTNAGTCQVLTRCLGVQVGGTCTRFYYPCSSPGWAGSSVPACGQTASYQSCGCSVNYCKYTPFLCSCGGTCNGTVTSMTVRCH